MNDATAAIPEPETFACPKCVDLRKLLKQKHGECWPCAQKRHGRDWKRNEGRRR